MIGLKYDDKFLLIFWDKMRYFKSHYIYPTQETLLKWLRNQGGLGVSRRTLNRYLKELENRGIIQRRRRVKKRSAGGFEFASTLYSIGILGVKKLQMLGVIAREELKGFMSKHVGFGKHQSKKKKKYLGVGMGRVREGLSSMGEIIKDLA